VPPFISPDEVIVLIPSLRKEGGVDVFVALYHKHADELRNIAYTMD
jgi:shikimate O-hydroxycinnamoyltransferase